MLTTIPIGSDCAFRITQAGFLATMYRPMAADHFNLNPALGFGATVPNLEKLLNANGVAALLHALPFGAGAMRSFGQASMLAGLISCIYGSLKVNLLRPTAAADLANVLAAKLPAATFDLHPNLAPISGLLNRELLRMGAGAQALKSNLDIDLFAPNGAKQLATFLRHGSVRAVLPRIESPVLPMPTLRGLTNLSAASAIPRSLAALKMPRVGGTALPSGSLFAPFAGLRTPGLAPLWPSLSSGSLPNLRLPNMGTVSRWNAQRAALAPFEKLLGLKSSDPRFAAGLFQLLNSFRGNEICSVLHDSLLPANAPGLAAGLLPVSSAIENVREGLGVDLLAPDARVKLVPKIDEIVKQSPTSDTASPGWGEILSPLRRLAELGQALA